MDVGNSSFFNQSVGENSHNLSDSLLNQSFSGKKNESATSMNNNDSTLSCDSSAISMFGQNYHYKRDTAHRIFSNRSFQLSDIKFFGFDMDHTLAVYKSAAYDLLAFNLTIERLIQLGYPKDISKFQYDSKFAIRGLWFDKLYGNILKVDPYGNILTCVHGFKVLKGPELYHFYPNKFASYDRSRFCIQHTLYEFPETYLLACVVDYFSNSKEYKHEDTGVTNGEVFISYKAMYQDVRESIENLYRSYTIQKELIDHTEDYIEKDECLITLLTRIRENGAKAFLLTNADYNYADKIMSYMLNDDIKGINWRFYFDYVVVDARKPLFFEEGTTLKEINISTKTKNIGTHKGPLRSDRVYSGGSCQVFSKLIESHGKDVLYVGDHIYGDIIKSKKERAWHTFLIVPEIQRELKIWHEKRDLYTQIEFLGDEISRIFMNFDSSSKKCPDISNLKEKLQALLHELDMSYSFFGSAFRSGSRQTYFASQVTRYADIYSATCLNLIHYPFFYLFKSAPILMPHESTVNPDDPIDLNLSNQINRLPRLNSSFASHSARNHASITATNSLFCAKADALHKLAQHQQRRGMQM